ncbi:fam-d protein [Plasmodium vinckei]|uniref:Fam-d protein n=1 Tax=Plasmodium vinckei TaxID=5860 RepID=A0A6V7SXJ6_PLAVN|nr:fam-d protein [Plasmodium vinckei]
MKMMNIILSFFILGIFSNVKAATFQNANNNSPKSIGVISVPQPMALFPKYDQDLVIYLNKINEILYEQSEDIKYAYEGSNYHWVITDFDISINNFSPYLNKSISKNRIEALQTGTRYFITYINANIKHIFSRYMHKYDFEKNYDNNLNIFAKDLKALIYDPFDKSFKDGLIKYENEPETKKLRNRAKKTLNALMHNSEIQIKGYFIKISKDGNYTHLRQNKSLCFKIRISKDGTNVTHDFLFPKPETVQLIAKTLGKP